MKKKELTTLAMIGISAGLMVGGCQKNQRDHRSGNQLEAAEQMSPDMRSFYSSLSPDAQRKFMQLDAQHKMMAMEMVEQNCNGKNLCQGMGGCQNYEHSCAGKNSCKGQGGEPVRNPEEAVSIQYNSQMDQRGNMKGY